MAKKIKKSKRVHSRQKKQKHGTGSHGVSSQQHNLQQALAFHRGDRFREAEVLYRQILGANPDHPEALYHLGTLAHQAGKNELAAELIHKAIVYKPDYAIAHNYLGTVLIEIAKFEDAAANYHRAVSLKPDYVEAHYNLGNALHALGRLDEAADSYRRAIALQPGYLEALCNLGKTLYGMGKLDEAADSFSQAIAIGPDYAEAHYNLGVVLQDQDKLEAGAASYLRAISLAPEVAEVYQNLSTIFYRQGNLDKAVSAGLTALEKAPADNRISDYVIGLLNNYMPNIEVDSPYIAAQKSLQQVSHESSTTTPRISDETVRKLYQQCHTILASHNLEISTKKNQLFRGIINTNNCPRHLMVFNTLNIIPEFCFGCFKVTIEPRTVMELFKLLLIFDTLELPNDNPRKCIVEVRPEMSGTYKGFIYCGSLNEGKEILNTVRPIIEKAISEGIPSVVKRGCSEFQAAYPEYGHFTDNTIDQMLYTDEWRKIEADADKNMNIQPFENPNNFTHNHPGFTLLDILVMQNWLAYAARIGDVSYLKIVE